MLFILFCLLPLASADVLRTVFCQHQCNDYLKVAEASMPLCAEQHLKMNECGTVITCDWAEAERDKVRPVANTTDIVCCYRTLIKEKGDCDIHEAEPRVNEVSRDIAPALSVCAEPSLPWIIASVLLIVVAIQAGYIIWSLVHRPSHQKVTQLEEPCARPLYIARPLLDNRLLA